MKANLWICRQGRSRTPALALTLLLGSLCLIAQSRQPVTPSMMMPLPANAIDGTGEFAIDVGFKIVFQGYKEARLDRAAQRFMAKLHRKTGILNFPEAVVGQPQFIIQASQPSSSVQRLGEDESYHLEVSATKVVLNAPNPLGVLHGLQSFVQLVRLTPSGFVVSSVTIDDKPRFPWRGFMLDTGRHFMPLAIVRQTLDGMEAVKLNVFHWHLSDDQGFRIESKLFPLLQEEGSDGLYYTQDQVRDVLAYARDRGIRVIPEFDMPGHASAWFVGYPNLASGKGPYHIERKWGIFDPAMDPTRESTYEFLDRLIGEMTRLFPDAYFHIGGDECNGKEWDASPRIQEFKRGHNLKDNAALQAYFTSRVQKLVTRQHKVTIGWDEVLQPDTPKDVVIQSWRGQDSLAQGARRGYHGILSAGYYLDLNEPASQHYAVDPLIPVGDAISKLTPQQEALILGGEAAMWTEYVTPEDVGGRIWPRAAAISERLWSPKETRDVDFMYKRLAAVSHDLGPDGLSYELISEKMLQRLVGNADTSALKVLAGVVEPPKEYAREEMRNYDLYTPLNRLVDLVPAESNEARLFRDLASRIASTKGTPGDYQEIRKRLTLWRDNDAVLSPLLSRSALTIELVPVSRNLTAAATIGLLVLDALEKHQQVSASMQQRQLAALKALEAPEAVLLNRMVPGVETLVRATQLQP